MRCCFLSVTRGVYPRLTGEKGLSSGLFISRVLAVGKKSQKLMVTGKPQSRLFLRCACRKIRKSSLAVTYLFLKCVLWLHSSGLWCQSAKCPKVCFHRSALIIPELCQKQHDTAFQAASHTLNNSPPKPFIWLLCTTAHRGSSDSAPIKCEKMLWYCCITTKK